MEKYKKILRNTAIGFYLFGVTMAGASIYSALKNNPEYSNNLN